MLLVPIYVRLVPTKVRVSLATLQIFVFSTHSMSNAFVCKDTMMMALIKNVLNAPINALPVPIPQFVLPAIAPCLEQLPLLSVHV